MPQGSLQARVLEHLAAEGRDVMAEFSALAPGGPPGAVLKLLSDVDDTVFSSGGSFPAGSDTRYPKCAAAGGGWGSSGTCLCTYHR